MYVCNVYYAIIITIFRTDGFRILTFLPALLKGNIFHITFLHSEYITKKKKKKKHQFPVSCWPAHLTYQIHTLAKRTCPKIHTRSKNSPTPTPASSPTTPTRDIISNPFRLPPPLADYWNENERRERWPAEVDKYPRLVAVISCRHFPRAATVNFVWLGVYQPRT